MVIGLPCCCNVEAFARKTAVLYVPWPGYREFAQPHVWRDRKYLTYRVWHNAFGGTEYLFQYNRYTGVLLRTQTGPGPLLPPNIPIGAAVSATVCTYTDGSGNDYTWELLEPYEYVEAIAFWTPHFEALFPTASMPAATTITARAGVFNAGNPHTISDRQFDFLDGYNHIIRVYPYGTGGLDYNGGLWDGTFEFSIDSFYEVEGGILAWLGGKPAPVGNPAGAFPDEWLGIQWHEGAWRAGHDGFYFTKSCLRLPQGMNCDVDYYPIPGRPDTDYMVEDGYDYPFKDVVRGLVDVTTGIVDRTTPNLRLAPGVYTFYDDITVHSGAILSAPPPPAGADELSVWLFRRQSQGVGDDSVNFQVISDYCPP